ncbi:Gfo/Idh/MocA family oxidoreductase [bacterium]|nr:Gfo/Idh/MocA family oxidoreductase [bacterium]
MKNFAITGVAGYIAPRHLKAIKDTGNTLIAAMDPHDSVGLLDRYFPDASFFTEFERFDRHIEKLKRDSEAKRIHYLSVCSPNNLHDAHIRLALRTGSNVICEKPLVLNPWNLDALEDLENEYRDCKVYTVLQLRLHPSLMELKSKIESRKKGKKYDVVLTYVTARGVWYDYSWKSVIDKSGGISTNIGIHFFDMLIWLFGDVEKSEVHLSDKRRMSGALELRNADVSWFLSTEKTDLPADLVSSGATTYRSIKFDGEEIQFSDGFTDLHTRIYEETLAGRGFGILDCRPSIELVYGIRNSETVPDKGNAHPFLRTR